jgi:hypothetical protein
VHRNSEGYGGEYKHPGRYEGGYGGEYEGGNEGGYEGEVRVGHIVGRESPTHSRRRRGYPADGDHVRLAAGPGRGSHSRGDRFGADYGRGGHAEEGGAHGRHTGGQQTQAGDARTAATAGSEYDVYSSRYTLNLKTLKP